LEEGAPWEIHAKTGAGMASGSRKTVPERHRPPSAEFNFLKVSRYTILRIRHSFR